MIGFLDWLFVILVAWLFFGLGFGGAFLLGWVGNGFLLFIRNPHSLGVILVLIEEGMVAGDGDIVDETGLFLWCWWSLL